jgi:hypothetical protein
MTSSIPIIISGKTFHLRYTYPDFKAMENQLGIGYLHFLRPEIFNSLTAIEVFLWRGLKKETPAGDFVAAFPLDEKGPVEVGNFLWSYLQEGGDISYLATKILESFTTTGPFRKKEPEEIKRKEKESAPKNLKT